MIFDHFKLAPYVPVKTHIVDENLDHVVTLEHLTAGTF